LTEAPRNSYDPIQDDGSPMMCCGTCFKWQHILCHDEADRRLGRPKRNWDVEEFVCRACSIQLSHFTPSLIAREPQRTIHGVSPPGQRPPAINDSGLSQFIPSQSELPRFLPLHKPRGIPAVRTDLNQGQEQFPREGWFATSAFAPHTPSTSYQTSQQARQSHYRTDGQSFGQHPIPAFHNDIQYQDPGPSSRQPSFQVSNLSATSCQSSQLSSDGRITCPRNRRIVHLF
jgi:hypothetical protein